MGKADPGREGSGRPGESSQGGFLLGKAARLSERRFSALVREAGLPAFEPGQGRIVFLLGERGELPQKELAALAGLDKSSLALTLSRLEEKGLVARRPDPADGRRFLVSATEEALAIRAAYETASRAMTDRFYEGFSKGERASFETFLERIIDNLGEGRGTRV